jgi:hypothetical protein
MGDDLTARVVRLEERSGAHAERLAVVETELRAIRAQLRLVSAMLAAIGASNIWGLVR